MRNEVDVMKYLKANPHPNVVKCLDVFEDNKNVYLVMECLNGGTLGSYLNTFACLTDEEVKSVAIQISQAMEFLHSKGIMHRDIKTENIMLTDSNSLNNVKIIDFGFSKVVSSNDHATENFGTLVYTAPEILKKSPYNNKVDVWSLGILLYYLRVGYYPFDDFEDSSSSIIDMICNKNLSFPNYIKIAQNIKLFIISCLEKSYEKRLLLTKLII